MFGGVLLIQGHIYVITNKLNGKQYVGQTSRNIEDRYYEHCYDKRSTSKIHKAIQEFGVENFELRELETVELAELDTREQYWIQKLDTYRNGYNANIGGNQSFGNYQQVLIVEANLIVDSVEFLGREIQRLTDWSKDYIKDRIQQVIDTDNVFCGYHLKHLYANKEDLSDIIDLENWIKTLNVKFAGQHIYCLELDKEFETIGTAARYLIDNGYYTGSSKQPIQTVITILGKAIKGGGPPSSLNNMTFYRAPGTTKQPGNITPYQKTKIYCPEIDKHFESQSDAAEYFIQNKIWTGIKLKTAKCRISDIVNGVFPDYKGYAFIKE